MDAGILNAVFSAGGAGGTILGFFMLNKWMDSRRGGNGSSRTTEALHRLELAISELRGATENNGDILRDIRDELRTRRG